MRSHELEHEAQRALGAPHELSFSLSPPPNVTMQAHCRGLSKLIERFFKEIAQRLRHIPPPDYLLATPELIAPLEANHEFWDPETPSGLYMHGRPNRSSLLSGRSQLKVVVLFDDHPDFPLAPGEGWFTYGEYHQPFGPTGPHVPAKPTWTIQVEEHRLHPLQRLARCAE